MTAAVIAAILKEKLTLKSPDEIDIAVRNPDTGSTLVRMNLENPNGAWGRPRVQECGDSRAYDDRDEEARPKSSVFSKLFLRHVHYDAVRSDRGRRWLSDQGGEL